MSLTCHICGKSYTSKFNFDYHVAHHYDTRPFNCNVLGCQNAYKTKADLRQHQKSHEKALGLSFICVECQLSFDSSTKLNVHKRDLHCYKRSSFCELCNREFTNLRMHQRVVHERFRPYECDLEGKKFAKLHGLKRHIEAVHLNLTPFACEQCDKRFKEASDLRRHQRNHEKVFKSATRFRKLEPEVVDWGMDEEIILEATRFKCHSCSRLFSTKDSLLQHERKAHSNATFVCDFCLHRFESRRKIWHHIKAAHLDGKLEFISLITTQYKCGVLNCGKILSSKKALERHKRVVHQRIYDFVCDKCAAEFRDRGALNEHCRRRHHGTAGQTETSFKCELCGKKFLSSSKLENHEAQCRLKKQMDLNQQLDLALENEKQLKRDLDRVEMASKIEKPETFEDNLKSIGLELFVECNESTFDLKFKHEYAESDPFDLESMMLEPSLKADIKSESLGDSLEIKSEVAMKREGSLDINGESFEASDVNLPVTEEIETRQSSLMTLRRRPNLRLRNTKRVIEKASNESDGELENINESELERAFKGETFNVFSRSFECKICSKDFEKLQALKVHFVCEHRIKKFKCNFCNHSFAERKQMRTHCLQCHPKEPWQTSFFLREFAIPNESVKCNECSKVMSRKESLKRHMELVHSERPLFYCDQCTEAFRDCRTLINHVAKIHSEPKGDKMIVRRRKTTKPIACEECGEIVYGRKDFLGHRWSKHLNFKIFSKSRFHCLICEQVLKCRASAKRHHYQVHREGRLLLRECRVCNTSFKLYQDFKAHVEVDHHHDHICLICGNGFQSFSQLIAHEKSHRTVAEDDKKHFCDLCGWRAQQKVSIEAHMVRQHGAIKKQYQATCEFCGQSFTCYQSFHAHRKSHLRELNKVECNYCDKAYSNQRDLKNHEESHISREDKPFRCEYDGCFREYDLYRSYRWHVKYSHEQIRNQCRICCDVLSSREKLIAHTNKFHPEQRRFRCNRCGKTFTSHTANVKHMRNCEPTTLV